MSSSTPFLIGSVAGGVGEAARKSAKPHTLSPAEQAVDTVDFKNSRREELHISTSEELSKLRHSRRILFRQDPRPESVQRKDEIRKRTFSAACSSQF